MKNIYEVICVSIALLLTTILSSFIIRLSFSAVSPSAFVELKTDRIAIQMRELRMCESGGNDLAIHHFDGKTHSYGRYQWKEESLWYYQQKYNLLPDIEQHEIMNVIYDTTVQDMFTRKVLENGGHHNWKNCFKKIGV